MLGVSLSNVVDVEFCFVFSGHMEQYAGKCSSLAESPTQDWTMLRYRTTSVRETDSVNHISAQTNCESAPLIWEIN